MHKMGIRAILVAEGIAIAGMLLILVGAWMLPTQTQSGVGKMPRSPDAVPTKQYINRLERLIAERGPQEAYIQFKQVTRTAPLSEQHLAAHFFGDILYAKAGAEAVAVCDSAFQFGCYHGLFTRAIAREGVSSIAKYSEVCAESDNVSACRHGLGHGILSYAGHGNVEEALSLCQRYTQQQHPLQGCTSGVFMEYHVPIETSEDGDLQFTRREFDQQTPYEPCQQYAPQLQASCFYEKGQWWSTRLSFRRSGELCAGVSARVYRDTCFLGIGNRLPSFATTTPAAKRICDDMPTVRGVAVCRASASWRLDSTEEMCGELSSDAARVCRTASTFWKAEPYRNAYPQL